MMEFVYDRVENIDKGENAGDLQYLLFQQCFQKLVSQENFGL